MKFAGMWHITEMEMWDEDYFNMETQAYVQINPNGMGNFQFGLVTGQIHGDVTDESGHERFEFTWEGSDELDPVSGSGWLRIAGDDSAEGNVKIHAGDRSGFTVEKVQ